MSDKVLVVNEKYHKALKQQALDKNKKLKEVVNDFMEKNLEVDVNDNK